MVGAASSYPALTRCVVPVPPDRVVTDPARLRWGTVTTVRAPLRDIARFAAHHLSLGASKINLFLDTPDPETQAFFADKPKVDFTVCDDAYWAGKPAKARRTHQLRQAFNATRCYRRTRLDWLAHIDIDEFLLPPARMSDVLAGIPAEAAFARLRPAEMLAQPDPFTGPAHFKLTRKEAGATKADLRALYPTFGDFVPEGFLSYTGGKNIARTGLPGIRFGIHALLQKGKQVQNGHLIENGLVGHAHAPNWARFRQHFAFRLMHGSYRKKDNQNMLLQDVLETIIADEGEAGLRRFFDEMCTATPRLIAGLETRGMLKTAVLDLDKKVARRFGALPEEAP